MERFGCVNGRRSRFVFHIALYKKKKEMALKDSAKLKTMTIKMIPGERNEERIAELNNAMNALAGEKLEEYFSEKACQGEEWLDAMYYAAKDSGNDTVLSHWEEYFKYCLVNDEKYNFASDCGNFECTVA